MWSERMVERDGICGRHEEVDSCGTSTPREWYVKERPDKETSEAASDNAECQRMEIKKRL